MNKHIFLLTRYSMLSRRKNYSWDIPLDPERQKGILFAPERLRVRERLFFNVTLPSVQNQRFLRYHSKSFTYLIFTSEDLPSEAMSRIQAAVSDLPYVKIVPLPPVNDAFETIDGIVKDYVFQFDKSTIYASARLDDDDALSFDYLDKVNAYLRNEFAGFALSFARGIAADYDSDTERIQRLSDFYFPMTGLGLCHIKSLSGEPSNQHGPFSVYGLREHQLVDRRVPCILDSRKPMIFRTRHSATITSMKTQFCKRSIGERVLDGLRQLRKRKRTERSVSETASTLRAADLEEKVFERYGVSRDLFRLGARPGVGQSI